MTEGTHNKQRLILTIISVVAVIVVTAGAGFGLRYYQNRQKSSPSLPTVQPLQSDVNKAQNLALSGNYDAAHKQISSALQNSNLSTQDRYDLLMQQGATYQNQDDNQAALQAYQQAAQAKETQNVYELLAGVAEKLGNKEQAITYYKKAIQLISSSNAVGQADKETDEQHIRDLGGQP